MAATHKSKRQREEKQLRAAEDFKRNADRFLAQLRDRELLHPAPRYKGSTSEDVCFMQLFGGLNPIDIGANCTGYGIPESYSIEIDRGTMLKNHPKWSYIAPHVPNSPKARFVSHPHVDHFGGLCIEGHMGEEYMEARNAIKHYGMPEVQHGIKPQYMMNGTPPSEVIRWEQDPSQNSDLKPGGITKVDGWTIQSFHVRHSCPARCFLMTAPNGVTIFHTGDMRWAAGTENDSGYHMQVMEIGKRADVVVMDTTHVRNSGRSLDATAFYDVLADIAKEEHGNARVNVLHLSSGLPTVDVAMDAALRAGNHVTMHGWYGPAFYKAMKLAGHQYSELEGTLDANGYPLVMCTTDTRNLQIDPKTSWMFMTGQYFEPGSVGMKFARNDPVKAKYHLHGVNRDDPRAEHFVSLRGPYPDMKTEWSNMWKGVQYLLGKEHRLTLHGVPSGPWKALQEEFGDDPNFILRELSVGGHCKKQDALTFLTFLNEGARMAGRKPPVLIPTRCDYSNIPVMQEIADMLAKPMMVPRAGQTVGFHRNGDVYLARDAGMAQQQYLGFRKLPCTSTGEIDEEKGSIKSIGGPMEVMLTEYSPETGDLEEVAPLADRFQAQDRMRRLEGLGENPLTQGYWPKTERILGLDKPVSEYAKMTPAHIPVDATAAFDVASERKGRDRPHLRVVSDNPDETNAVGQGAQNTAPADPVSAEERKTDQGATESGPIRKLRGRYDRAAGSYLLIDPGSGFSAAQSHDGGVTLTGAGGTIINLPPRPSNNGDGSSPRPAAA